jgi:hypothetical protein
MFVGIADDTFDPFPLENFNDGFNSFHGSGAPLWF